MSTSEVLRDILKNILGFLAKIGRFAVKNKKAILVLLFCALFVAGICTILFSTEIFGLNIESVRICGIVISVFAAVGIYLEMYRRT